MIPRLEFEDDELDEPRPRRLSCVGCRSRLNPLMPGTQRCWFCTQKEGQPPPNKPTIGVRKGKAAQSSGLCQFCGKPCPPPRGGSPRKQCGAVECVRAAASARRKAQRMAERRGQVAS